MIAATTPSTAPSTPSAPSSAPAPAPAPTSSCAVDTVQLQSNIANARQQIANIEPSLKHNKTWTRYGVAMTVGGAAGLALGFSGALGVGGALLCAPSAFGLVYGIRCIHDCGSMAKQQEAQVTGFQSQIASWESQMKP